MFGAEADAFAIDHHGTRKHQALNAGSRPEDLVASLPVVMWEDGIDDVPPKPRWKFWA